MGLASSVMGSFDFADAALRTTAHQRVQTVMFLFVVYWLHIFGQGVLRLSLRTTGENKGIFRLRSRRHRGSSTIEGGPSILLTLHSGRHGGKRACRPERNASGVERVLIIQFHIWLFFG